MNEEMGSVLDGLKHMSREMKAKFYKNRAKYMSEYWAFQAWGSNGCVSAPFETNEGIPTGGDDDAESSW
jgi:hypothetical protein